MVPSPWPVARKQVAAHPAFFDVRRLFARNGGSLPSDPGTLFTPGMALCARHPGGMISTVGVTDPKSEVGSLMLHAGWRVGDQACGAPYDGYLPFPVALLSAVVYVPRLPIRCAVGSSYRLGYIEPAVSGAAAQWVLKIV